MTAALPDMDRDMQALARQTIRKLEAMTDADFEDMRFLFTDEYQGSRKPDDSG